MEESVISNSFTPSNHRRNVIYGERTPHPALAGIVRCFWWLRSGGPTEARSDPDAHGEAEGVLPDGSPELILNFAQPFLRSGPGLISATQPLSMLVGATTRPMVIKPTGRIDLWGVRFEPAGAHALFRLDMAEITDGYVDIDQLGGPWATLRERLGGIPHERRLGALEGYLARIRPLGATPISAATALLRHGDARVRVDEAAAAVGLGARQLLRRFRREVGVGPKTLSRIFRFQRFLSLSSGEDAAPLSSAAYLAGYHDQSHMAGDFRRFAGAPPAHFLGLTHELADLFTEATLIKRPHE